VCLCACVREVEKEREKVKCVQYKITSDIQYLNLSRINLCFSIFPLSFESKNIMV